MREEKYLESIQREILRSKKWQRFVKDFDIGVAKRKRIHALPVKFTFCLPTIGETTPVMQYLPPMHGYRAEILVADTVYDCLSGRIVRLCLTHELLHHYLRTNDVPFLDADKMFKDACKYLGIHCEMRIIAMTRNHSGKDRRWRV
jgi:hypothetical protein